MNNEPKYTCADLVGDLHNVTPPSFTFHQKRARGIKKVKMIEGCMVPPPFLKYGFQYQVHRAGYS